MSIPSNIAEGHGRASNGDLQRFVAIAHGSLAEVETQFLIAERLGYISEKDAQELRKQCMSVGQVIQGFTRFLKQQSSSGSSRSIGEEGPESTGEIYG